MTAALNASRTSLLSNVKAAAKLTLPFSSRSACPSLSSIAGEGSDAHCLPLVERMSTPRAVIRSSRMWTSHLPTRDRLTNGV